MPRRAPKAEAGPRGRVPDRKHKAPEHKNAPNSKKRKLVIAFDPDARKEYLTGFSKRKEERRKYGLAMGELKARKDRLEERKETRESKKEQKAEGAPLATVAAMPQPRRYHCLRPAADRRRGRRGHHHRRPPPPLPLPAHLPEPQPPTLPPELERHLEIVKEQQEASSAAAPVTEEYADDLTLGMFGDVVTVTTSLGSLGNEDEEDDAFLPEGGDEEGDDETQRYANSFKAAKEKIDSKPLSTKQERRKKRNQATATLEGKFAKKGKSAKGKGNRKGGKAGLETKALAAKAVKATGFKGGKAKKQQARYK